MNARCLSVLGVLAWTSAFVVLAPGNQGLANILSASRAEEGGR